MLKWVGLFVILSVVFGACSRATPDALPGAAGVSPLILGASSHYKTLFNFNTSDGARPEANLIDVKGTLYGTTAARGAGVGTVFSISPAGKYRLLHTFNASSDGGAPVAGLIFLDGLFYGTTSAGGKYNGGTVFSMTAAGKFRVFHTFNPLIHDGSAPEASLTALHGVLYGTTVNGGNIGFGTVFSVTKKGKEKVIYSFDSGTYGQGPEGSLIALHGVLYGTTFAGGVYSSQGTVFSLTTHGKESVLHSFCANGDGCQPQAGLILVGGMLYGMTRGGGTNGLGTVFRISTSGAENVIHSFDSSDGEYPSSHLIAVKGTLYGTTFEGGAHGVGTVFRMSTAGKEQMLYSFESSPNGNEPYAGVTYVKGAFFGTTGDGGSNYAGTVFRLSP